MEDLFSAGLIEKSQIKSLTAELTFLMKDLTQYDSIIQAFPNYGNNEEDE